MEVTFKPNAISVKVDGASLLGGKLFGQVDTDDCVWCLVNGGTKLQMMLTKSNCSRWPGLLKDAEKGKVDETVSGIRAGQAHPCAQT